MLASTGSSFSYLHPFFVSLHDMKPLLHKYFGFLMSLDEQGEPIAQLKGYEPPQNLLKLTVRGDLDGMVTFALKEGINHKKAYAQKAFSAPASRSKAPSELTIPLLDELLLYFSIMVSAVVSSVLLRLSIVWPCCPTHVTYMGFQRSAAPLSLSKAEINARVSCFGGRSWPLPSLYVCRSRLNLSMKSVAHLKS